MNVLLIRSGNKCKSAIIDLFSPIPYRNSIVGDNAHAAMYDFGHLTIVFIVN